MRISFAYEPRDVDGYIADYILVACIQNISARCIERIMASETCGSSYIGGSIFFGDSAFEPRIVGESPLTPERMMQVASEKLKEFEGMPLFGNPVEKFSSYITGPKRENGTFKNQKMRVIDKHGFEHICYNAKVNVFLEGDEPYYIGLQHSDLFGKTS